MIGMEKPAAMLYASSAQKPLVQRYWKKLRILKRDFPTIPILALSHHLMQSTVGECDDMTKALKKSFNSNTTGMYHGKLKTTSAFSMNINVNNVTLIIHTTLPISQDRCIQEIGRAGRTGQQSKQKIMSMILFTDAVYKYRQQLAYYPFLWPENLIIPE
uniref:Uncharacterized protein n=1 Tax=Rhizophagus irregularis (strain DAOM 181602 / DAOM 197198 / MUCL 43194) TaxID=747089 RepID=U9TAC6_RHIID